MKKENTEGSPTKTSLQFKMEFASSLSGVGAFLLGIGTGLVFFNLFQEAKYFILGAGLIIHGIGMYTMTTLKNEKGEQMFYTNHWLRLLMWICTVALIAIAVYLFKLIS